MKRKRNKKMENNETTTEPSEFDTKAFTEALLKQVKAAGGTKAFYKQHDIIKELTRATYQALLDAEMEEHLGYEKNDRESKETLNSRNGKGSKKIRGDFGEVELETPRDRKGTFDPQIVKKRQSSVGSFADKVVSLYARGMTTREGFGALD
jgi:transposase-like protein